MRPWSRNLIKRLELRIPLISEPNCGHCRQTMRGFFPALEYLVLFYPHTTCTRTEATLEQNLTYYSELAERLPVARIETSFDGRNVRQTPLSANIIKALAIAINKDPDTEKMAMRLSFHVTYETSCYEQTVQQAALVDANLRADVFVGPVLLDEYHAIDQGSGDRFRQLDFYYERRAEVRRSEDLRVVEDESEEEARLFKDWDLESAAKKKKQRVFDWKYPRPPPPMPVFNHFHDADEWDEPQTVAVDQRLGNLVNVVGGDGDEQVVVLEDEDADSEMPEMREEEVVAASDEADADDGTVLGDGTSVADIVRDRLTMMDDITTAHETHEGDNGEPAARPSSSGHMAADTENHDGDDEEVAPRLSSIGHINTEYDHYDGDDEDEDAYVFADPPQEVIPFNRSTPRARFPIGRMAELFDGKYSGWYLPDRREMLEW